jgi:hypothetical protein
MTVLDQWFTPDGVAEAFLGWANVSDSDIVLEPAAGEGALVPNRPGVLAFEIDPERVEELRYWRPQATVVCADFLQLPPPAEHVADVCIENPPYSEAGEGVFLYRGLLWAPRCCGLLRAGALQGSRRWDLCWRYVRPTRIASLVHRPHFQTIFGAKTQHTPQYDYMAIECVLREQPLEREVRAVDEVEFSWVFWR